MPVRQRTWADHPVISSSSRLSTIPRMTSTIPCSNGAADRSIPSPSDSTTLTTGYVRSNSDRQCGLRLTLTKLVQAYDLLVPGRERVVGARVKETEDEASSDLRAGVVRAATRGTHHCQPNGGADRVCAEPRFGGAEGVGVRRRRF